MSVSSGRRAGWARWAEGRRRTAEQEVLHEAFRRGWPSVSSLVPPPSDADVCAVLARVLRQARQDWLSLDASWGDVEQPDAYRN